MLDRLINGCLNCVGLRLSRTGKVKHELLSFESNLRRLIERKVEITAIIDIGASDGCWSRKIKSAYPNAYYLLIEANSIHEEKLKTFCLENSNSDFVVAVAGEEVGEIYFDSSDPFGGTASKVKTEKCDRCLPCVTIDSEVAKRSLSGPFLIKLDTHGFEVSILNGAEKALRNTNLIFVETYNFDIENSSLRFWEMCEFLYHRGFRPIDFCEPMHRPKDGALWQVDIIFVRRDREEFKSNCYE